MKSFFFVLINLLPLVSTAETALNRRVTDLRPGTKIEIQIDAPELLQDNEKSWHYTDGNRRTECYISVQSRFDKNLAIAMKRATYEVVNVRSEDTSHPGAGSTFQLDLDTEDRRLPFLFLVCYSWSPQYKAGYTLGDIQSMMPGTNWIGSPLVTVQESVAVTHMLPGNITKARTKVPLYFSFQSTGTSSGIPNTVVIYHGQIFDRALPEWKSTCSLNYRFPTMDNAEITIPAQTIYGFHYAQATTFQSDSTYQIFAIGLSGQNSFTISCSPKSGTLQSFNEITEHLNGVIEFE
jgi:hypothetical protein